MLYYLFFFFYILYLLFFFLFFFFNDTATTEIYTLSLHDALPICVQTDPVAPHQVGGGVAGDEHRSEEHTSELQSRRDLVCRLLLEKKKKGESRHPIRFIIVYLSVLEGSMMATYSNLRIYRSTPRYVFFFNDTATTEIYTLSLHDALPI